MLINSRLVSALATIITCSLMAFHQTHAESDSPADSSSYELQTIAKGLKSPWAMAFLPNGDILVTERSGKLKVVRDQKVLKNNVDGVPDVYFSGQGGLMDIMLDQDFSENKTVYLSLAHGKRKANATRLISATLESSESGYSLENQTVLFTASPMKSTAHHHGGRIAQLSDGSLLMSVGDGYNYREQAQTLDNHFGKIIRINRNGSVPKNNPFVEQKGALPEIYSFGHRNQQGLVVAKNVIYEHEHGPKGGDEINIIKPAINYGWPVATFGIDYNGASISPFTSYEGMQSPTINWTPSIAPSAMAMHQGELYVTSLAEQSIRKISVNGENVGDQGIVFKELKERLRDVLSGPDGQLYVITDGDDARVVRIAQN